MFELNQDFNCVYCGQSTTIRALIVNKFGTLTYEFVCERCIKEYDIELGFRTHSGDQMVKDIFFLIALVFFACVDSWGACSTYDNIELNYGVSYDCNVWNQYILRGGCGCGVIGSYKPSDSPNSYPVYGSGGTNSCVIVGSLTYGYDNTIISCDTQAEADSVACVNGGQSWNNGVCGPACDSTKYTCETSTATTQTTIANENQ